MAQPDDSKRNRVSYPARFDAALYKRLADYVHRLKDDDRGQNINEHIQIFVKQGLDRLEAAKPVPISEHLPEKSTSYASIPPGILKEDIPWIRMLLAANRSRHPVALDAAQGGLWVSYYILGGDPDALLGTQGEAPVKPRAQGGLKIPKQARRPHRQLAKAQGKKKRGNRGQNE